MDFTQLHYFVALAETLHFGRCAEQLGIAQPQLSRAIASLEAELGVRLFERTSRRVELTAAGKVFLLEVNELLHTQQRAINVARAAQTKSLETLKIGFVSFATFYILPATIRQLKQQADFHIELYELTTNEQIANLQDGKIDLGLGHPPVSASELIVVNNFWADRYDVLLYQDHPLAQHASLTFDEVAVEPLVLFPEAQGPVLYNKFRELCRKAGKEMQVAHMASRLQTIQSLVSAGLGIAFVPRHAKNFHTQGTLRVPLVPYPEGLELEFAAFYDRRNSKQSLKLFLEIASTLS